MARAKRGAAEPAPGRSPGDPTWRSRAFGAAAARQVPLATIVTVVVVGFVALDLNALLILMLWVLREVILYLIVAGFLALLMVPPTRLLKRTGMSHGVAATLVFLLAVVVVVALISLFTVPLASALTRLPTQLKHLVDQAQAGKGTIGHLIKRFHLQRYVHQDLPKLINGATKALKPAEALKAGTAAVGVLFTVVTIAVMSFFVLLEGPKTWAGLLGLVGGERAARVERVSNAVGRSVAGYMVGNISTSVIAGIVVFIALIVLGVPFAGLLGLWVALVDLLPLVGGALAGIPVVVIALLHSVPAGIVMLIVFLVYQQIENHLLNPVIMYRTVRLNPLWVLLAVLIGAKLGSEVGGALGTFVGALIGIPVGGALQVLVTEVRAGPGPAPGTAPGPEPEPDPEGAPGRPVTSP
jgi:predicted PurR-regulated permease PerM